MNKCFFMGYLTQDPVLNHVGTNNAAVVNFTVAINRPFKRKTGEADKEVAFLPCEAWDSGAETIHRNFKKGDPISVECFARTETWEKDGKRMSKIKFRVERFYFIPNKKREESLANVDNDNDNSPEDQEEIPF